MHEVSLMQDTLILAAQHARQAGGTRIHRLMMRIGPLSGVVPETLEFAFEIVAKGTIAEGGRLEIERVPIVCHCRTCDTEFTAADMLCECPTCKTPSFDLRSGREMHLMSVEVS
jgi:hydrogenase nickel incorporation protein HypA/HybF